MLTDRPDRFLLICQDQDVWTCRPRGVCASDLLPDPCVQEDGDLSELVELHDYRDRLRRQGRAARRDGFDQVLPGGTATRKWPLVSMRVSSINSP